MLSSPHLRGHITGGLDQRHIHIDRFLYLAVRTYQLGPVRPSDNNNNNHHYNINDNVNDNYVGLVTTKKSPSSSLPLPPLPSSMAGQNNGHHQPHHHPSYHHPSSSYQPPVVPWQGTAPGQGLGQGPAPGQGLVSSQKSPPFHAGGILTSTGNKARTVKSHNEVGPGLAPASAPGLAPGLGQGLRPEPNRLPQYIEDPYLVGHVKGVHREEIHVGERYTRGVLVMSRTSVIQREIAMNTMMLVMVMVTRGFFLWIQP